MLLESLLGMFAGGTNADMACDFVLHLVHNNAFSAVVVGGQGRSLPGLQLQSLFLKSRDVTSEFSLDVESLWNGSGGLENLECATCILAIQALSLFWWH